MDTCNLFSVFQPGKYDLAHIEKNSEENGSNLPDFKHNKFKNH
jgi:hypothetical protein